jgi:hypothetical protein
MVDQIRIQVRAAELLNAFGVLGMDVAVAHVLADHLWFAKIPNMLRMRDLRLTPRS